jgi:hypothetical protein
MKKEKNRKISDVNKEEGIEEKTMQTEKTEKRKNKKKKTEKTQRKNT